MKKILVVEDHPEQLKSIEKILTTNYPSWIIDTANTYEQALSLINASLTELPYTFFLLDIQLSSDSTDRQGFSIAQKIRENNLYYRAPVIFLTCISDEVGYALNNYHCYNYLTKPYKDIDLLRQIEQLMLTGYIENSIEILDTNRVFHNILIDNILYISTSGHKKLLHLTDGTICTRSLDLKWLQEKNASIFFQCHRCYIININYITNIDMTNNYISIRKDKIPISRTYKAKINSIIHNIPHQGEN